jgi:hypothetical protein
MLKDRSNSSLAQARAAQALQVLIEEGKLKAQDVTRALARREAIIRELHDRLAALGENLTGGARRPPRGGKARVRRGQITKAQRAARQAQGRYLGAIRRLSKAERAKVKTIREKKGVRAAVAAAKRIAKG